MRQVSLSVCLAFAFFVASAAAQMAPNGSQGTQNSSPSMQQPGQNPNQQPETQQPTSDQNTGTQSQAESNHEHTIKGCVQSEGTSYTLETKKGKQIALAGQDVSAHVGHEVAVKGTWEKGNGMSSTSAGSNGTASKTFNVSSVKMISDTCKMKSNSGMGSGGNTSSPSGTGQSTQPPQ